MHIGVHILLLQCLIGSGLLPRIGYTITALMLFTKCVCACIFYCLGVLGKTHETAVSGHLLDICGRWQDNVIAYG